MRVSVLSSRRQAYIKHDAVQDVPMVGQDRIDNPETSRAKLPAVFFKKASYRHAGGSENRRLQPHVMI